MCFSNISNFKFPVELIDDSSQLKFDGEGNTFIVKHISLFLKFCEYYEINCEYASIKLFTITLEGRVNKWCQTLPSTSIHSFEQLVMELH